MRHDEGVPTRSRLISRLIPRSLPRVTDYPSTPGLKRFTFAHSIAAAADAFVTVSLAGSLFFSISPDASRRQVLIYLIVTMAPFAVLAPLIGPSIDRFRGGHRWLAVILYLNRAGLAIALGFTLFTLWFYFLALALLVANKASGVLKSALVPGLVEDPSHLVASNSRLARVTTIVGGVGGSIAAGIATLGNSQHTLFGAAALFVVAAIIAARLPEPIARHTDLEEEVAADLEYQDLHRPLISVSATAYTAIRFAVGAFVFGLAFALRRASEPAWMYGAALVAYGVGAYLGNLVAPMVRRRFGEDRLLGIALLGLAVSAAFAAAGGSRILIITVAAVMGAATTFGRQGFDSLVQRTAPRALHGRSFARFETKFQIGWVVGATFSTAAAVPTRISLTVVAALLIPATALYLRSAHRALLRSESTPEPHLVTPDLPWAIASHLTAAEHWLNQESPRLAMIELAAAMDLAIVADVSTDHDLHQRCSDLRRRALGTQVSAPDDHQRFDLCEVRDEIEAMIDLVRSTALVQVHDMPTSKDAGSSNA
jgi:MFS family permease